MESKSLKYLKWGFVFLFFHVTVVVDLLPDFVGALLLYASIQSHKQTTEAEDRVKFLFLVLAADYFLHWIFPFSFILENLLITIISMYALYVLLGEVAGRIREKQPDKANSLNVIRILLTILNVIVFVASPYENAGVNALLALAFVFILIVLLFVVGCVEAVEE